MFKRKHLVPLLAVTVAVFLLLGVGIGLLLTNIRDRLAEGEAFPAQIVQIGDEEIDPAVWGLNYPRQYDAFMRTEINYGRTPYGGSEPYDKRAAKPFLEIAWAGFPFAKDYNEERGHFYAQIDQRQTRRVVDFPQPGACVNCHTGEFTRLMREMGWDEINRTPYNELAGHISDLGMSCADCHEPNTMALRITRPALINALTQQGIDPDGLSRQEMRSYVCAQCHVEYYFLGPDRTLTFPWSRGMSVEAIEQHFDQYGHRDWVHELTGAPMIKIQHPEFELFSTSTHYASGVSCADCHMPYTREGGVKISDHWVRSPLTNLNNACQTCHRIPEDQLQERILTIQNRTKNLLTATEAALLDAINAIVAAQEAGAADEALDEARQLHRASQLRWDFIDAENSMGFHSPQEAVRILGHAVDLARQAQLSAEIATVRAGQDASATAQAGSE